MIRKRSEIQIADQAVQVDQVQNPPRNGQARVSALQEALHDQPDQQTHAKLTLFAIPKKFEGHIGRIQRNAIRSWAQLRPHVQIVLFGQSDQSGEGDQCDDPKLIQIAEEVNARLVILRTNDSGTPVLADAFEFVHANINSTMFCYVNCDIVFGPELLEVANDLRESDLESFLGIGQRTSHSIEDEIQSDDHRQLTDLIRGGKKFGKRDSIVCKDYFLFTSDLFQTIPEFLVGRGNWDNWMVAEAKSNGVPVVDLTSRLTAIHQNHDYSHVAGGRKNAYVFGDEARKNQQLAGGRNLIFGSTPTWELTTKGPKKRRFPFLAMFKDVPRFMSLLRNLLILGYLLAGTALTY